MIFKKKKKKRRNCSNRQFSKKNEQIMNVFEDYESTKHAVIWYKRSQII